MERGNSDATELHQVNIDEVRSYEEQRNHSPEKQQFVRCTTCSFSKHEYSALEAAEGSKTTYKLCGLMIFYSLVMLIEVVGGLRANSLAILTDAAHLLSDIAGFTISLFTVWVSSWEATPRQSYGFNRLEVIGVLLSVQLIWLVSGSLIYEAIQRFITEGAKANGKIMFGIAAFGFLINLLLVLWLGHDHSHHGHSHLGLSLHGDCENNDHTHKTGESVEESINLMSGPHEKTEISNINIQGAYLHLITDLIQSVGVMIAGSLIWIEPSWYIIDLVCTLVFSTVALVTTFPMLKTIFYILMERAPDGINTTCLENGLRNIEGVCGVHDLHVWAITLGKHVLSCHVVVGPEVVPKEILHEIREYCAQAFRIYHVTIQIEQE